MAETEHFGWPAPDGIDVADVPADVLALATAIEKDLHNLDVAELGTAGVGDSGKLLVVSNTGFPAWRAISGDASVNHEGVLQLQPDVVGPTELANDAVETAIIKNLAVTAAKIALEAVGTAQIANLAVTVAKLANEAVETGKIKNFAVTAAKIAEAAVEELKIKDGAVSSRKFKPTVGYISASEDIGVLNTGYKDVPGTSKKISVAVKSFIIVHATFEFFGEDHNPPYEQILCYGKINLNGVDGAKRAFFRADFVAGSEVAGATVGISEILEVAAGEHTLKLRAKTEGAALEVGNVESEGTGYDYMVVAA